MENDTPQSRPASWLVPYFGLAATAIVVVVIGYMFGSPQRLFPSRISDDLQSSYTSAGTTQARAIAAVGTIRTRALAALAANGLPPHDVAAGPVESGRNPNDSGYWASQMLTVHADDYPRFARLSNRINRLKDPDFGLSFPRLPNPLSLTWLLAIALLLAVGSTIGLETRRADVSRSPKGMHPAIVAIQTLTYGVIVAFAFFYVHMLGDGIAGPFVFVEAMIALCVAVWLFQTRRSWTQSNGYRIAYGAYIVALVLAGCSVLWAATQPVV